MWRCPPYPLDRTSTSTAVEAPKNALQQFLLGENRPACLQFRQLLAIGVDLDRNPFFEPIRSRIEAAEPLLRLDNRLLMNERSNPDFGWNSRGEYSDWEMERKAVKVVGGFPLQRGFGADGAVICSDRNFADLPLAVGRLRQPRPDRRPTGDRPRDGPSAQGAPAAGRPGALARPVPPS